MEINHMKTKKKIQWLGIFILLGVFTYSTISTTFGDKNINISMAATQNFSIDDFNNNIIVLSEDQDILYSEGFIKKLSKLYANQEMCIINDDQLSLLLKNYSITLQDFNIMNDTLTLVEIKTKINKNDLFELLGLNQKVDCKLLKRKNVFFFLLSPQIS